TCVPGVQRAAGESLSRLAATWRTGRSMGPAPGSCASSAKTSRSSSASLAQASVRKASRSSGVRSLPRWYNSSICRRRSGFIAIAVHPIILRPVIRSRTLRPVTPFETAMDQTDVFLREVELPAVHLGVVASVPMRLHDAAGGVPADGLQNVGNLVRQHMSHQEWRHGRSYRGPHAIVEQHDARALEGHRIGKGPGMPIL